MALFEEHLGWASGGGTIVAAMGSYAHHIQPIVGSDPWMNIWFDVTLYPLCSFNFYKLNSKLKKDKTTHHAAMHSIAFAVLCGELTYLIFILDYELFTFVSEKMPEYFATAVFVGYLTHLSADVVYARKKVDNPYSNTSLVIYSDKFSTPKGQCCAVFVCNSTFL
jgi:hypothetical protein